MAQPRSNRLRHIPSVEFVLQALGTQPLPRPMVIRLIRDELARWRRVRAVPERSEILDRIRARLTSLNRARLQPVINATGIIIHTNLGRSLLAPTAIDRLMAVASRYSSLEIDLETGGRGGRAAYLEQQLAVLCQAEAASVVNNCAAALILILRHLVRPDRPEVILSRGELVQIGGGFRIPEILETSGARLREVGTTNRTTVDDYRRALSPQTALILKVHRSNFTMDGFVGSPSLSELSALARRARVPLVEDLGSGGLIDTAQWPGFPHEPTPAESLRHGVDLVCFSGDKLLGGPQAGILAGRRTLITSLQREPLFRALRCDKLVLAALEATADLYLEGAATAAVPTLAMAAAGLDTLRPRAERLAQALAGLGSLEVKVSAAQAHLGGGTLPGTTLASVAVALRPAGHRSSRPGGLRRGTPRFTAAHLATHLRRGSPAIIGVLADGWLKLDLRTVLPEQDDVLIRAVTTLMPAAGEPTS